MVTEITARYEENYDWPILRTESGREKGAGDNFGDIECPFCDKVLCNEGSVLKIGDKCRSCGAEVIKFKDNRAT